MPALIAASELSTMGLAAGSIRRSPDADLHHRQLSESGRGRLLFPVSRVLVPECTTGPEKTSRGASLPPLTEDLIEHDTGGDGKVQGIAASNHGNADHQVAD